MTAPPPGSSDSETAAELDRLVKRTQGLQPLRRLFHASGGLLCAGLYGYSILSQTQMLIGTAALLGVAIALDLVRLRSRRANLMFFQTFSSLASPREEGRLASSTWYLVGILAAIALYPLTAAIAGILILALGDPSASYVGRRWGRIPFGGGGTVLGTATFAVRPGQCRPPRTAAR